MTTTPAYTPPTSADIQIRQNGDDALRLLLAQRRLHSKAKWWQGFRWFGLLVIGVAAPPISVIWPSLAVVSGAVAGAWLFLGRTVLTWLQTGRTTRAAAVQEELDLHVFAMPRTARRSTLPLLDEIAKLAGPNSQLRAAAASEKLLDWYPITDTDPGEVSVAISQRTNAAYSHRLLRTTVGLWTAVSVAWAIILVVWSVAAGLSLPTFLAGVALPMLPASLDVFEFVVALWRGARDREDLARTIDDRLADTTNQIEGEELLVWQERMYELRRGTPQVPNWLYKLTRGRNEEAMQTAASQLSRRAGGNP